MKRTQFSRIVAIVLTLGLAAGLVSCGPAEQEEVPLGSAVGRELFAEAEQEFAAIEQALARWTPDRSAWSDGYLMRHGKEGPRDAVLYQVRNRGFANYATPVLERRMTGGDGTEYTVMGMEFQLDDELKEPHWFAVLDGCRAIYEYDPAGKRLLPFGTPRYDQDYPHTPAIGKRAEPDLNLTDVQSTALARLLDEYSGRYGYFPYRLRFQLMLSSSSRPATNMEFYMDGYYLPKKSLTQFKEVSYISNKGDSFWLTTALFEENGREVQRWFILPQKGEALYEFLPAQRRFKEIIFNDASAICDVIREKSGLGEDYEFSCEGLWGASRGEEAWYSVRAVNHKTDEAFDFQWFKESKKLYQTRSGDEKKTLIWNGR